MQLLVKLLQQWRKAGPVPGLASLLMVGAVHALLALKPAELTLNPVGGDKTTQVSCFAHCPCISCLFVHNKVMGTRLPSCVCVKHVPLLCCAHNSILAAVTLCIFERNCGNVYMSKW